MARGGGFEPPWDKSHWISNPTQWPDYATPANSSRPTGHIRQLRSSVDKQTNLMHKLTWLFPMTSDEIDWDIADDVEWGVDDDIEWEEIDTNEEILIELRNDPQPSFFVRKFAVVWWRKGFYKAGKVDGTVRATPTKFLFLDKDGKTRLKIDNSQIASFELYEHDGEFPIFYNELITKSGEKHQITTGVNESQSKQNHQDLKNAISGDGTGFNPKINELKIITSNDGKLREFSQAFEKTSFYPVKALFDYPEIQASTLEKVVDFGLAWLKDKLDPPFVIDDAGVFVNHLKGFPGVYSRYVYDTIGLESILKQMENVEDRRASFKCVLGLLLKDGTIHKFSGESQGEIIDEMRGDNGFGYDPIFVPSGSKKTFAEMSEEEKNSTSHRGEALTKLVNFISNKDI